jgi:hypothetical protein
MQYRKQGYLFSSVSIKITGLGARIRCLKGLLVIFVSNFPTYNFKTMYTGLLHTHSSLRYIVLLLLVIVVVKSLLGLINKKPFTSLDNKVSLWLLIATHLQLVVGFSLFFVSPFVQFSGAAMKDSITRYWTVEHNFMMLIAIALITIARISHKKMITDQAKHKRLFLLNVIALLIIIVAILYSGRGLIIPVRA